VDTYLSRLRAIFHGSPENMRCYGGFWVPDAGGFV
jgi:hypothetical protein